jgi:hypothetical protein
MEFCYLDKMCGRLYRVSPLRQTGVLRKYARTALFNCKGIANKHVCRQPIILMIVYEISAKNSTMGR